ncbi:uncharacterized protein PAC_03001 [Phialocephala subalpina]|uniref:C2H2-type domain-containing protein n=1 Tax=Phialocephala subalpina TaxID=576137 RepID=A0A1L7WK62_9HELO|nr:uncharacterized protein PAC_03001 [Phialocephala subalpina]
MADGTAEDFNDYAALPGDFSGGANTYNNGAKPLEPTSIHQPTRLNDPDRRNQHRHYPDAEPGYLTALTDYYIQTAPFYTAQANTMSLSYESRNYPVEYPQSALMQHDPHEQQDDNMQRYPSPPPMGENPYGHQNIDAATALNIGEEMPELPQKEESDAPSPGRSKPIPKPDREVTKGDDGRFVCTWAGCTEEVRSFNRKCEWSKHMDKHDRPYKCPAEGCEKLPGFTYSGGLLRHQREVHNLHGGPRKQLNCPHPNCKRFSGKGFSRQENLNEHLRRVHTDGIGEVQDGAETEEEPERAGMKRKRPAVESPDLRQELAKLRKENEALKRQAEQQSQHMNELSRQVQTLQSIVGVHALPQGPPQQAPPAQMTSNQGMSYAPPSPMPM